MVNDNTGWWFQWIPSGYLTIHSYLPMIQWCFNGILMMVIQWDLMGYMMIYPLVMSIHSY